MKTDFLIDTHCHLSLTDDIDSILMDAEKNNVKKIIISGCDKKSIRDGLEIIYRYPSIYMTVGFHPDEADLPLPLSFPDITLIRSFFFNLTDILIISYTTSGARDNMRMYFLALSSRPTGPKIRVPLGSPLASINTAALSSKRT